MVPAALAAAPAGLLPVPAPVAVLAALLAAALAGGAWGAIPGILKSRFGAHEVINTIMMNFIAFALVAWLGHSLFEPATVRTRVLPPAVALARLAVLLPALRGSPANTSLLLALVAAALP